MDSKRRVFISIFALFILIVGLYFFTDWFSKTTGYALGEDQKIKFAQCLAERGTVIYETASCSDCEKQRVVLGENAYGIIAKQMCDAQTKCAGLKQIPAWEIEGKFYYGLYDFKQLDEVSSCEIGR